MGYEDIFAAAGADDMAEVMAGALLSSGEVVSGDIVGDIVGDDLSALFTASGADDLTALLTAAGAAAPAAPKLPAAQVRKFLQNAQRRAQLAAAVKARQIQGFSPTTFQYTPPNYDRARIVPMGFDSVTAILPGAQATITQRPQVPFRPARLFIPSDISGGILVVDFKIGNKSQLAANAPLPGRMFQEDATDSSMLFDTASPALDVTWVVQNISGSAIRFIGSCKGPAVELPSPAAWCASKTPRATPLARGVFSFSWKESDGL